jgi:hypothetical protein
MDVVVQQGDTAVPRTVRFIYIVKFGIEDEMSAITNQAMYASSVTNPTGFACTRPCIRARPGPAEGMERQIPEPRGGTARSRATSSAKTRSIWLRVYDERDRGFVTEIPRLNSLAQ